jgi:hypothetical protein
VGGEDVNKTRETMTRNGTRVDLICGASGCDGNLVANGHVYDSMPPSYTHVCDKCGRTGGAEEPYPQKKGVWVT